jgi:hypothetical protein
MAPAMAGTVPEMPEQVISLDHQTAGRAGQVVAEFIKDPSVGVRSRMGAAGGDDWWL